VDNDNPYLNLLTPNGGETIPRGTRFLATWKSDVAVTGDKVIVELYKDGNYIMPLTGSILNKPNGSYQVLFPASLPVGSNYNLALTSVKDPRISDQSDAGFSVIDNTLKLNSLAINNGAATTIQRQVFLNNRCGGSPVAFMASESATFSGAIWKPYATAPVFVVSPGNGNKRVYVKIKNNAGQESAPVSDTIVLREALVKPVIKPIADTQVPEHQPYTSPAPVLLTGNIPIFWSLVSGPAGIKINPSTGAISWADPKDAEKTYRVTIRASNKAGYGEMSWNLKVKRMDPALGVDLSQLAWNASESTPWFTQSQVSHDGVDAARNRPIGNNQKSVLRTSVSGSGVLTFWWKVSSERNCDTLSVYLDNKRIQTISGEVAWTKKSINVPAGKHTITWTYVKDGSDAAGADAGYVDQVTWKH
jgi:hypothetical protein